jgi:hypothetical protein
MVDPAFETSIGSPDLNEFLHRWSNPRQEVRILIFLTGGHGKAGHSTASRGNCCRSALYRLNIPRNVFIVSMRHKKSQGGAVLREEQRFEGFDVPTRFHRPNPKWTAPACLTPPCDCNGASFLRIRAQGLQI